MYFSTEKCSDKKELQESSLITFSKSALLASPTTVSIYPPRRSPFVSNLRFHLVILLDVK
jgi:hypothetical protein